MKSGRSAVVVSATQRYLVPGCIRRPSFSYWNTRRSPFVASYSSTEAQANISSASSTCRMISSSSADSPSRIPGLLLNPDSAGKDIMSGNVIHKLNPVTKETRLVQVERELGHFWMMKDLTNTGNKPTLSNTCLIPVNTAGIFPSLSGWKLLKDTTTTAEVPGFFLRKNRANDETAQCTLVAISFKEFGHQMLSSWTDPFEEAFREQPRAEVVRLSVTKTGGALTAFLLQSLLMRSIRSNTPVEQHDTTLLYFGSNSEMDSFCDALRMHNTLTSYVYLLDGKGRIRFAASGEADIAEQERLIQFARELTPKLRPGGEIRGIKQKGKQKQLKQIGGRMRRQGVRRNVRGTH